MLVSVNGAELYYSTRGTGVPCIVPCIIGVEAVRAADPAAAHRLLSVHLRRPARRREVNRRSERSDVRCARLRSGGCAQARSASSASSSSAIRFFGVLALEYGRRCPDAVSHVIMAGTPPSGDIPKLVQAGTAFFEEDGSEERKTILKENYAKLPPGTPPTQAVFAQTPLRFLRPSVRCDAAVRRGGLQAATVSARARTADGELGRDD